MITSLATRASWRAAICVLFAIVTIWITLDTLATHDPSSAGLGSSLSSSAQNGYSYIFGSSAGACPSPFRPILPVDRPLSHHKQTCRPVQSAFLSQPGADDADAFNVEICAAAAACNEFTVRITRASAERCAAVESAELPSEDEEVRAWFRSMGPDSFMLRTSGAQRWQSVRHRYEGKCAYSFDVSLSNGGDAWLEVWWGYTEYKYMDETSPEWPLQHHHMLFTSPLKLSLCPAHCPLVYPPRLVEPEPTFPPAPPAPELPPCPRDTPVNGIWLMRNPMDVADPPFAPLPPRQGARPLMGHYDFRPTCRFTHAGRAYTASAPGGDGDGRAQVVPHDACTATAQKVLFVGDSHTRYSLLNILHRLTGHTSPYPLDDKGVGEYGALDPARTFTFGELTIDFVMDAYAEHIVQLELERLASYDAIVFSNGAWSAMAGKTTAFYKERIQLAFDHVAQVDAQNLRAVKPGQQSQKRVYLVPAPFPPQTRGLVVERKEHRTNLRLAKWRDEALVLAERAGWRVVDQYERGMPVVLEMLAADALHLSPGAAIASIVDEIIDKAGMCQV